MRIAVTHDLPSGGAKRMLREQVVRLAARGHIVEAFLPTTAEEGFLPLSEFASRVHSVDVPAPPDRERALRGIPGPGDAVAWIRFLRAQASAQRTLARMVDSRDFDVALAHPSQFTQAPACLRHLRTPSVYFCQEPLRAVHEPGLAAPAVRFLLRYTLGVEDRRNLRAADEVAVSSRYVAALVSDLYGRPARVVRPGIDVERFTPGKPAERRHLLSVGALHPLKGHDFLVQAVGRLPERLRLPLVIVADRGRSAYRSRLEDEAAVSGVDLRIRSRVSEEALVDLYREARVVLFAAHREPLGLVPLEAMACGRPVLAIPEGGVEETVEEESTGYTAPRDPGAFSVRLAEILEAGERAEAMGEAARGHVVREWGWTSSIDQLEALLETVAEEAR